MLNKEFLMVGSDSLEPVLSIYISPYVGSSVFVVGTFSSGDSFSVYNAGETTFKFSEIELTANILIAYYGDIQLSLSNLISATASYSGRAPDVQAPIRGSLRIKDKAQSASISIT